MTRSSPGVKRMAAVLDFMADHPGQAFALTDLVRALKLSRATCHALLTGLVEVGYLYRTSDKTYVLGPALLRIGAMAADHVSPLSVARPEMRALADAYDVVCTALFLEGDAIVCRERAASVSHVGYSLPLGTRIRLRARSMTPFYASDPQSAAAFLAACDPPVSPAERASAEASMAFARQHGFSVHVRKAAMADALAAPDPYAETGEAPFAMLSSLSAAETYPLSSITAPVINGRGQVEFVIGLMGFNATLAGAEVSEIGARLMQVCARVGTFLKSGRPTT